MNPVVVEWEIGRIAFHPHGVDQSCDALCNTLREERLDAVVNFFAQLVLVRDSAFSREERAVYALHRMIAEEFGAELDFIKMFTVKPIRISKFRQRDRGGFFCFGQ